VDEEILDLKQNLTSSIIDQASLFHFYYIFDNINTKVDNFDLANFQVLSDVMLNLILTLKSNLTP